MYKPAESTLKALYEEFKRASTVFPSLYHQQIYDFMSDGRPVTDNDAPRAYEMWKSRRITSGEVWQYWHGPHPFAGDSGNQEPNHSSFLIYEGGYNGPVGDWYGRFFGAGQGLEEFQRLAEALYVLLSELDALHVTDGELRGVMGKGWVGLLELLYDVARVMPSPLLRVRGTLAAWAGTDWACPAYAAGDLAVTSPTADRELLAQRLRSMPSGDVTASAPMPFVLSMRPSLFSASMTLIQMLLDYGEMTGPGGTVLGPGSTVSVKVEQGYRIVGRKARINPEYSARIRAARAVSETTLPTAGPPQADKAIATGQPQDKGGTTHTLHPFLFRKEKGLWHLKFRVDAEVYEEYIFPVGKGEGKGFDNYALILQRNGQPIACLELSPHGRKAAQPDVERLKDKGSRLEVSDGDDAESRRRRGRTHTEEGEEGDEWDDDKTNDALKVLIAELEDDLEIAKDTGGDSVHDIEDRIKELKEARRSGGDCPLWSPSPAEEARRRVKRRLYLCRQRIGEYMPRLALHLERSVTFASEVKTGAYVYRPDIPHDWLTY